MTDETKGDEMTLEDRVEFALRDAGFDYDEASRIAHLAAQSAMRVDEEDAAGEPIRNCNVCGTPVMYGERHSRCGEAVMREVRAALQAAIGGKE